MSHRLAGALLALLVGCGGGGDGASADVGTDGTPTSPVDTALCDAIPQFELSGMTCDQIESAFSQTMSAARDCITSDDCKAVDGQCESFVDAACWYPVNPCVDSATVSSFASAWSGCPTQNLGCSGCPPEPEVQCLNNRCAFVETY